MFGLKKLERKVKALILLALTGGVGVGGYTYRDHPIVRQLLGRAEKEAEANGIDVAKVEDQAKDALKAVAGKLGREVEAKVGEVEKGVADKVDSARPGTYEVAITAVRVDPTEFRAGRSAELDVRVVRHPVKEGDEDTVVWQARATARATDDSDGLLELSWADRPFRVDWTPGDEYTIEVRDRKFLGREDKWFALDLDDDGSFPLRSKTHKLASRADGKPTRDPSANAIVLKSHRVEPAARDRAVEPAVAEGDHARRSTRR